MRAFALLLVLLASGPLSAGLGMPPNIWFPDLDDPFGPPGVPGDGPGGVGPIGDFGGGWDQGENDANPGDPGGGDPAGLPPCDCAVADPDNPENSTDCGDYVSTTPTDSSVEDPDAPDGGSTNASEDWHYYDTDGDGDPDCSKSTPSRGCVDGDKICECLAENRAELVAIKGILQGFEGTNSLLKTYLNQMLEMNAPTIAAVPAPDAIPGFEGQLNLPFNGMPQNSVLTNLSEQDFGFTDPAELAQRSHEFEIGGGGGGAGQMQTFGGGGISLPGFGTWTWSTDPTQWPWFGSTMEQVRVLFRGFLLVCVYWSALSHVWGVLLRL